MRWLVSGKFRRAFDVLRVAWSLGDAMPAGKFDKQLPINGQGCLSPAGPMTLDKGETAVRVDVWVFQEDNAACMAV